jgi:hypothetical protein
VFESPRAHHSFLAESKTHSGFSPSVHVAKFLHTHCTRARDGPLLLCESAVENRDRTATEQGNEVAARQRISPILGSSPLSGTCGSAK